MRSLNYRSIIGGGIAGIVLGVTGNWWLFTALITISILVNSYIDFRKESK